jgi:hypothetical protein
VAQLLSTTARCCAKPTTGQRGTDKIKNKHPHPKSARRVVQDAGGRGKVFWVSNAKAMHELTENKTILTVKTCLLQIYTFNLSPTIPATPLVSKRTRAGFLFL